MSENHRPIDAVDDHSARQKRAREWREGQLGQATRRGANWRTIAMGELLCLVLSFGVIFVLIVQYRAPPPPAPEVYVIDPQGTELWRGAPGSYEIKDVWVASRIEEWVKAVRTRPGEDEPVILADNWNMARKMTTDTASVDLEAYFKDQNPLQEKFSKNPMRVRIPPEGRGAIHVERRSGTQYDVDWTETWTPTYGQGPRQLRVAANISVEWKPQAHPRGWDYLTSRDMAQSRLSVYVTRYAWTLEKWLTKEGHE